MESTATGKSDSVPAKLKAECERDRLVHDEAAIAAGTVLLTGSELAVRLGYKNKKKGTEKILARARCGKLPHIRLNCRKYLFHWPTVISALNKD